MSARRARTLVSVRLSPLYSTFVLYRKLKDRSGEARGLVSIRLAQDVLDGLVDFRWSIY